MPLECSIRALCEGSESPPRAPPGKGRPSPRMRRSVLGAVAFLAASMVIGSKPIRPGSDAVAANPASIVFSTYFGGNSTDTASAVAVDAGGNTYITGWTASTNLPVRNAFQSHSGGGVDAFVAKFDPTGALAYCTYLGGAGDDRAFGIAVDAAGAVYLTGWTSSTDFPIAGNPYQRSLADGLDAFVAKLSATGESLIFSTFLGGASSDQGRAIALDASGDAFVAGQTTSSDFPTRYPLQTGLKGPQDAFVAEVDGYGALLFSTYLGGGGTDTAAAIAVGGDGCLYLTGSTDSLNFPALNAIQPLNAGYQDAFVTKSVPTARPSCSAPTWEAAAVPSIPPNRAWPSMWTPPATPMWRASPAHRTFPRGMRFSQPWRDGKTLLSPR